MNRKSSGKKTVNIRFIGSLRQASGKSRMTFEIEKAQSLSDLLKGLSKKSAKLSRVFTQSENRKVTSSMLILINGTEISALKGLDTAISQGDEVVFIPVVHGG